MTVTGQSFHFESGQAAEQAIKRTIEDLYRQTPDYMGRGREALMNAIEATQRAALIHQANGTPYAPAVFIGPNPEFPHQLCFADNGDGLGKDEVEKHLATISQSGNTSHFEGNDSVASFDQNKGIGVKASLLPENKAGLDYISWRLGSPTATWFRLAYDDRSLPVVQTLTEAQGWDGEPTSYAEIDNPVEDPELSGFDHIIKAGHGTILTLKGNDYDSTEPTIQSPTGCFRGSGGRGTNIGQDAIWGPLAFINRRFWSFGDVTVRVHGYYNGGNAAASSPIAKGSEYFLKQAKVSGVVQLTTPSGAPLDAYWHVMPSSYNSHNKAEYITGSIGCQWHSHGHVAFKYRGEVYYDYYNDHPSLRKKLREYGIWVGEKLVCIYVDLDSLPAEEQAKLFTNQQRTNIYLDRRLLSLEEFAPAFAALINKNDPSVESLVSYMKGIDIESEDDSERQRKIKLMAQRYKLLSPEFTAVVLDKNGDLVGDDEETPGRSAKGSNGSTSKPGDAKPGDQKPHMVQRRGHRKPAKDNDPDLPRIRWNEEDSSSEYGAEFQANTIEIFRKWPEFEVLIDHFDAHLQQDYPHLPSEVRRQTAWGALRHEVEKILICHVLRVAQMGGKRRVPFDEYKRNYLSKDALTAALFLQPNTESQIIRQAKANLKK